MSINRWVAKEAVVLICNGILLLLLLSCFSRVRLCETPWTAAHQAPPSMEFTRQEHWSGVPWPSPTMEYYSAIKRNTFESVLMRWINLGFLCRMKSEREKQIIYINAYIWNLERWYWWAYLQSSNRHRHWEQTHGHGRGEVEDRVGGVERITWKHTLPYVK